MSLAKMANAQVINIHSDTPQDDEELKNHMLAVMQDYAQANQAYAEAQKLKDLGRTADTITGIGGAAGLLGGGYAGYKLGMPVLGALAGGFAGLTGTGLAMGALNHALYPEAVQAKNDASSKLWDAEENAYETSVLNPALWDRQRLLGGQTAVPTHGDLNGHMMPQGDYASWANNAAQMVAAASAIDKNINSIKNSNAEAKAKKEEAELKKDKEREVPQPTTSKGTGSFKVKTAFAEDTAFLKTASDRMDKWANDHRRPEDWTTADRISGGILGGGMAAGGLGLMYSGLKDLPALTQKYDVMTDSGLQKAVVPTAKIEGNVNHLSVPDDEAVKYIKGHPSYRGIGMDDLKEYIRMPNVKREMLPIGIGGLLALIGGPALYNSAFAGRDKGDEA